MKESPQNKADQLEDEIDLIQLSKTLWQNRRKVILITVVFMFGGFFLAIFSPKEFTSATIMVPQTSEGGAGLGGSLGGFAALAGVNLGSFNSSDIPPSLYPQIVSSVPFQKEILQTPLSIKGQSESVTFESYYTEIYRPSLVENIKKYTVGLPGVILRAIKGEASTDIKPSDTDGLIRISPDEKKLIDILVKSLSLEVNESAGYVTLSANMPEPKAAAQLVFRAQQLLQEAITNFKIQKTKDQLTFVEERFAEKKKEFDEIQRQLAQFRDQNKNVINFSAQLEQQQLQSDYDLIYGVYSELAKELETKKIQVKQNTPVFTILQPATIPIEKSKPKRALILIASVLLGGILSIGYVFGQAALKAFMADWKRQA